MSTPSEIASQLSQTFTNLCQTFALLQPEEIDDGRMENGWSPKAVMAHVAFWDQAQTERMQRLVQENSSQSNLRQVWQDNDQRAVEDANRPWQEIMAEAESARKTMIDFVDDHSQETFETEYSEDERTLSPRKLFEHMVRHTKEHRHELSGANR